MIVLRISALLKNCVVLPAGKTHDRDSHRVPDGRVPYAAHGKKLILEQNAKGKGETAVTKG
jgi:hypothetical protein